MHGIAPTTGSRFGVGALQAPHVHVMQLKSSEGLVRITDIGISYAISESMQLNEDRSKY